MRGFRVPPLDAAVLIANVDGRFYASPARCPHEDVSLVGGGLVGTRVTCPGHAYEFDLATGRCAHDARLRLHRYRVSIEGDDLYIDVL
jgi:toluene monooxygenase system ferredoxin subunit